MNITNHAIEKYCERILEMPDGLETRQYITLNKEKITTDINKMIEYGEVIYTGQIGGDKSSKNYWLSGGNIILVTDTGNSTVITLYKVDFGMGEKINNLITENLVEEINIIKERIKDKKYEIDEELEYKKVTISNIDMEIQLMKEQLFMLEFKRTTLDNEVKVAYNDIEILNKQLESHAVKICNSLEYKRDLAKLNK